MTTAKQKQEYNCITVLGPTASGKTSLAVQIAQRYQGHILSADSRQVYKGLDIGSGKDLHEYGSIPYHLIDIANLTHEFSVYDYQKEFYKTFKNLLDTPILPVLCGGTGLYIDSVLRSYKFHDVPKNYELRKELENVSIEELEQRLRSLKKDLHNKTDLEDTERLIRAIEIAEAEANATTQSNAFSALETQHATAQGSNQNTPESEVQSLTVGIQFERSELRKRIEQRLDARTDAGLIEEVAHLNASGVPWERLERLGLEYRITAELLQGKIKSKEEWHHTLYTEICRFAKRQETWFRGMERKGVRIHWIIRGDKEKAFEILDPYFSPH